jgi:flagellar assembly protein FliH
MQSSYNIIKNTNIVAQGNKTIDTDFTTVIRHYEATEDEIENEAERAEEAIGKATLESYEAIAKLMVENARKQSESILSKAYEEAQKAQKEAFEKGYQGGKEQGYSDGYNSAYNETLPQAANEAEFLINNANRILLDAKAQFEAYLEEKKDEILTLSINIAETILKRELLSKDGLNNMIYEVLSSSRNAETFIIKLNEQYIDEISTRVKYWKESLGMKGEIFIVADETIEIGNAIIEKNNGKIEIGFDAGMEAIKQALF